MRQAFKACRDLFEAETKHATSLRRTYCFLVAPFLVAPVFGAPVLGVGFLAGAFLVLTPRGLIRLRASSALNGNWRTDVCPVVLRVTSTRRFWARASTLAFLLSCAFCAALTFWSWSMACLTCSGLMGCSSPRPCVSMASAETPLATR